MSAVASARTAGVVVVLAVCGLGACRASSSEGAREDTRRDAAATGPACAPGVAEKLGIPFVHVCPSTLPGSVDVAPYWIATMPAGCSAGEHDTVRCPPVVSVVQPREGDPVALRAVSSGLAAVVEAETAHAICTMRFGGRLPTRAERSIARSALGAASVLVTASSDVAGYRFHEVAEWVTEIPCEQPTVLAPECRVRGFPHDASPTIPWDVVTTCRGTPVAALDDRPLVGIDGECVLPRGATDAGVARPLPCLLRGPAIDPRARRDPAIAISCGARAEVPTRLKGLALDVAAFRCVVPEWH